MIHGGTLTGMMASLSATLGIEVARICFHEASSHKPIITSYPRHFRKSRMLALIAPKEFQ
jgi:hypothetical protein